MPNGLVSKTVFSDMRRNVARKTIIEISNALTTLDSLKSNVTYITAITM
jgi:hypothetical protein